MAKLPKKSGSVMAKEIKKNYRIPQAMSDYMASLASFMNVSENDVFKMIVLESMKNTKFSVIKGELNEF